MAKLDKDAVKKGLSLSKQVCEQPPHVFATPWMKNLLIIEGDVKQFRDEKGEWKTEKLPTGAKSKAVDLVNKWVEACLLKFNGPKKDAYDETLPVGSPQHYDTDCYLGWKPKIWDIMPGQAEQRAEVFRQYTQPTTNFSYQQMVNLIKKSPEFQKAILLTLETLPEVRASREVREISDPFMSKGTGVSYPDYRNDRTVVENDPSGTTYGRHEIDLVQKAVDSGLSSLEQFVYDNNVYTGYPRNQRGKGRALEAQSRRVNLVVNLLNAIEMAEWKESPILGAAFWDETKLKADLVQMAEWIEKHPDYCGRNEDTSGWDRSVGEGWITLSGALRYLRCNGSFSKKLCEWRHNCARKAWLVDGPNNRVSVMYGRTPSGYDDTTLLNSSVHRALANGALLSIDPAFTESVVYPTRYRYMKIVGDDICTIFRKGDQYVKAFRKWYKDRGYEIHSDEKSIFGVMFIQYRVIRHPKTNEWIMAYNWPRVLRSMLSKETAKQLGEFGWTASGWQQLGKLIEYPEMLYIPLNIIAALDKHHLHLDTPIAQVKAGIKQEDDERLKQAGASVNRKARALSTAERLFNSNPTIPGTVASGKGVDIDWDYFARVQKALRDVYDPDFFNKLGFQAPDLSKVHD